MTMNSDFARAMSRATASVRSQNLAEATAIIQAALSGRPGPVPDRAPASRALRIATDVEDAERLEGLPARGPGPKARRSLRDVVDLLRRGRAAFDEIRLPGGPRPPAPPLPEGASFAWRSHACAAGSRGYRLFVPSCPRSELRGLVLMLHGCMQNPDDFAAGTGMNRLAEEQRIIVAYPEQPAAANVSGCWNWFDPGHQGRDAGEPAILAALARDLAAEFGLPAGRVYAAGLSAGGAMAAVLAETYPDVFAAVGIHSGLPHGSARDVASAFAAMRGQGFAPAGARTRVRSRMIVFHGAADRTVHPANASAIVDGLPHGGDEAVDTGTTAGRSWRRMRRQGTDGMPQVEVWLIDGAGHAWSGGHASGSFADPTGPSASAEMLRFFTAARC
jgi:poly(hydroxyalkanoate) depolymerase family esterase